MDMTCHVKRSFPYGLLIALMALVACTGSISACPDWTRAPNSQWHIATQGGVFWLITPCGNRFFSIGINALNGGAPVRALDGRVHYHWGTFYPDFDAWLRSTHARVQDWGFNTAGGWSLHPNALRIPAIPNLDLGRLAHFHYFDPFDPATEAAMLRWARFLVTPYKGNPYRIGYFSDNEVGWWNGTLFSYYMRQSGTNYTKQKLIGLLRQHYDDDWAKFERDFIPPQGVSSFDALLYRRGELTHLRPGSNGIQVIRQWTGIVAEHYYRLVYDALHTADPEALIFADRLPIYYDPSAVRAMAPYVDAVATNYDVDSPDGWIARYFFDGLRQLTGNKPILISEWFFAARENRTGNLNNGWLMTVPTQAERARGAAAAARRFAQDPNIVGAHWFQYYDYPKGGREDGEDYDFGLVDINDHPYKRLVAALRDANSQLAAIHEDAHVRPPPPSQGPLEIPKAAIDAADHSLAEWPKARALMPYFVAPKPEVVFGDVYLAWSERGLHLATISMDYYDPVLLAYADRFPRGEAFHIDWGVDAGAGPHRFTIFISPPKVYPEKGALMMRIELCRTDHAACEPVPSAVATYFGSDTPRITAEVSLPWQALGVDTPPRSQPLRMTLAMTSFYRARWMSWGGLPPNVAMQDTSSWKSIRLGEDSGDRSSVANQ